jgi:Gas vesicle synthesis protein GvpL/GvpF
VLHQRDARRCLVVASRKGSRSKREAPDFREHTRRNQPGRFGKQRARPAKLDGIRGAVELGLHARWRDGGDGARDPRSESGTAYLRNRLEMRQSALRLARELDPLTALARSIRRALPQRDLPVLDAYLVDRARVGEFVALVAELGDLLDGVELVCTGPCPPYSFADGGVIRSTV